jgi:hypothetical protein
LSDISLARIYQTDGTVFAGICRESQFRSHSDDFRIDPIVFHDVCTLKLRKKLICNGWIAAAGLCQPP